MIAALPSSCVGENRANAASVMAVPSSVSEAAEREVAEEEEQREEDAGAGIITHYVDPLLVKLVMWAVDCVVMLVATLACFR